MPEEEMTPEEMEAFAIKHDWRKTRLQRRAEFIKGLQEVVDFITSHPTLKITGDARFYIFSDSPEEFSYAVRCLGNVTKEASGGDLVARAAFGPHTISAFVSQEETCERVVVGTKIIPATEEREVEIVEWICPPSFLNL